MANDKSLFGQIEELVAQFKDYVDLRITDLKLRMTIRWVKFFSKIVTLLVISFVVFLILLFLSFAFAYWFGAETGNWPLGFILTAAFWAIIGLLVYLFRNQLILDQVARASTEELFDPEKEAEDDEDQNI